MLLWTGFVVRSETQHGSPECFHGVDDAGILNLRLASGQYCRSFFDTVLLQVLPRHDRARLHSPT